eukprot:snap_masked-scaffold_6-processed-gene-4.42-mRNA-1 protein AED:1.00 eAED:1.00 QI:0/-1/0/0/-1/1/1/0/165
MSINVEKCLLLRNYSPNLLGAAMAASIDPVREKESGNQRIQEIIKGKCDTFPFFDEVPKPEQKQQVECTGRWSELEEAIVLRLALAMINCELKEICRAANLLGIYRRNRAIDHKLKRMLGFKKWKLRRVSFVKQQIYALLSKREKNCPVSMEWRKRIEKVSKLFG